MTFNPKELIDDWEAAGFSHEEAVQMAREEAQLRRRNQRRSDKQQAAQDRRRLGGFGRVD